MGSMESGGAVQETREEMRARRVDEGESWGRKITVWWLITRFT